jgi:hypothetical protein
MICHMSSPEQAHHATQKASLTPHCAECHRDHEGRESSLIARGEGQCTSCHAKLDDALAAAPRMEHMTVAIRHFYDGSHPTFRSITADPGRIKFNHALHMSEGLKSSTGGRPIMTFLQLSDADRARYGWKNGQPLERPVRLDCASCHRTEAAAASNAASSRHRGDYMVPISYQQDCAACHPLDVPGPLAVRHRLQPREVRDSLRAGYLALALKERPELRARVDSSRIPGRDPAELELADTVGRRVETAERMLYGAGKGRCTECHEYDAPEADPRRDANGRIDAEHTHILPAAIPNKWFQHAFFDHSAHQAVECRACHAGAKPDNRTAGSTSNADVLVPQIKTCVDCHAPAEAFAVLGTAGASYACVECHTYHNGDRGLARSEAEGRGTRERRSVTRVLEGSIGK